MRGSAAKIQMKSFDDLFQTSNPSPDVAAGERVQDIPLEKLVSFRNHPFQVRDDEEMRKTVDSVSKYGVLVPAIARPCGEDRYELVAGHRRKRASELANRETMPVIIREMDDDEATIIMVDTNLQREKLLPSEKAFAYKMKLEALKHQGKRTDLTSVRAGQKLTARDRVAQDAGETSGTAVARYIALTLLIPPLLQLVDDEKLSVNAAADYLSSMGEAEQAHIWEHITKTGHIPTSPQLKRIKEISQDGVLDPETIDDVLAEQQVEPTRITLRKERLRQYFPAAYTMKQIEEVVFSLLEAWKQQNSPINSKAE